MQLNSLTIKELNIPFKVSFQHSSAVRSTTETVLVEAKTTDGIAAVGEGCPRQYVTGETVATAVEFFNRHRPEFLTITDVAQLKCWVENHKTEIDKSPAAFCAVELALLSALAKTSGQSIEALLLLSPLCGEFQYTAVLGVKNTSHFEGQLRQYLDMGFRDFKVKIFGEYAVDLANIGALNNCGYDDIRVRLDANNLWSSVTIAADYIKGLECSAFALEEPLKVFNYRGCNQLSDELGMSIILDESFTRGAMFENIMDNPKAWVVNLRISKMGGLLRSLAIAERARNINISIIIGAQVGETSILTRAALTVANAYRDIVIAQEGAFGTHLLEYDIIDPSIMFGQRGVLKWKSSLMSSEGESGEASFD